MANPLINSGDAVLVVYIRMKKRIVFAMWISKGL